ncbi:aminotransferase class IV family protein [Yinghuangia soli]|uniref:Aminotransferase class IV family protein n=1 Tax=Yinghuangia soli TaxID=2908204 RepID=A0AA41U4W7_9ACTN|nr:aminotransferase class IV family protein [Yinghuangia soli]MCF2533401.1 aminotransferase class IV family protein [Yinghuangia soli]
MSAPAAPATPPFVPVVQVDGRPAEAADLAPLAFAGHAHFTAMQVRGGGIRGLDLHLARLRNGSEEMYGRALPDERIVGYLRTALAGAPQDVSLTAVVYEPSGEFVADDGAGLRVLVRIGPPSDGPEGPLALSLVAYERVLPHIKHVGEVAKTHYKRRAVAEGFDDAAFLDSSGNLSEASIWNLVFWDGTAVVWPKAPILQGTTLQILRRRLAALGVPQRDAVLSPADLPGLAGAAVVNSWTPGIAVHRIGGTAIPAAPAFMRTLHDAFRSEPAEAP